MEKVIAYIFCGILSLEASEDFAPIIHNTPLSSSRHSLSSLTSVLGPRLWLHLNLLPKRM